MKIHVTRNVDESKHGESAASCTFIQTECAFGKAEVNVGETLAEEESVKNDG